MINFTLPQTKTTEEKQVVIYTKVTTAIPIPVGTPVSEYWQDVDMHLLPPENSPSFTGSVNLYSDEILFREAKEDLVLVPRKMVEALVQQCKDYSPNEWVVGGDYNDWELSEIEKMIQSS